MPDYWLNQANPWEIERSDIKYPVRFHGYVIKKKVNGKEISDWQGGETVYAKPYDNPIPGYNTFNSINLRLFKSTPTNEFDFAIFNTGDYFKAIIPFEQAENTRIFLAKDTETAFLP